MSYGKTGQGSAKGRSGDTGKLFFLTNQKCFDSKSSVMPYLCSQRKLDVVKILPGKMVCDNKAVAVPHGKSGKGV